jgi:hypothetical protein
MAPKRRLQGVTSLKTVTFESFVHPFSSLLQNCAELEKYCCCMALRRGVVCMVVWLVHPRYTGMKRAVENV